MSTLVDEFLKTPFFAQTSVDFRKEFRAIFDETYLDQEKTLAKKGQLITHVFLTKIKPHEKGLENPINDPCQLTCFGVYEVILGMKTFTQQVVLPAQTRLVQAALKDFKKICSSHSHDRSSLQNHLMNSIGSLNRPHKKMGQQHVGIKESSKHTINNVLASIITKGMPLDSIERLQEITDLQKKLATRLKEKEVSNGDSDSLAAPAEMIQKELHRIHDELSSRLHFCQQKLFKINELLD